MMMIIITLLVPNRIDNDENDNNNDSNGLDMNQLFEDNAHADLDHLEMVNDDIEIFIILKPEVVVMMMIMD